MAKRSEALQQRLDRVEKRAPQRKKRVIVVTKGAAREKKPEADAEDAPTDAADSSNDHAE